MKNSEFPTLELTFAENGGDQFLVDASFRSDDSIAASRRLVVEPPRGKYFRAMCILMLLAKYRGKSFADENGIILFRDTIDRRTWIKTVGTSFGKASLQDFFRIYFQNCKFLSFVRGSKHNTVNKKNGKGVFPSAKYHTLQMPLKNLRFYKSDRKLAGHERTELSADEMALFAEKLERHEVEKPAGWQPIVSELIAKTKEDRPLKSRVAKTISAPVDRSLPYGCAPDWRNLFDEVRDGIEQGEKGNDWYVVTANPEWLRGWKGVLCREVFYHEANVRVIYHAPSTAKNSLALRAQSRVSSSRVAPNESDIIKRISVSLEDMKVRLRGWLGEMEKASLAGNCPKGAFHFFESYITHPFLGILVVPPGSIKRSSLHAPAPLGTWCLISVYPFEQFHYGNQCGIYLNSPSPMLDFYYNSILDFIELGPDAGYLKAVDLKTSRSGKGRKPKATG